MKLTDSVVQARRAILALKLGQVLEQDVQTLSVGVDQVQTRLEHTVAEAAARRPQSILIEGPWGTGKTHLLTLLTSLARARKFATSRVILDGEGVTLWEPMGLMEGLLGSLKYPGEAVPLGIGHRLHQVRRRTTYSAARDRLGPRLAGAIFATPTAAFEEPEVLDVMEDYFRLNLSRTQARYKLRKLRHYGADLPELRAWHTADRARRFSELLVAWAEFCVLTGAKGLAVLLDEVDVEYSATDRPTMLNELHRMRRDDLLEALSALRTWRCPLILAFGSAPVASAEGSGRDAAADLRGRMPGLVSIEAPQPTLEQTRELGRKLRTLYERAYGQATPSAGNGIEDFASRHLLELNPIPRDFVRGVLERLDVAACEAAATHQSAFQQD